MADMKELICLMKVLEDQWVVCMRCGLCQAVCPLYAQTGREADVARGKLALLDGLLQEMFDDPGGVNERLNRCLLCGSCAANCPSGVKVLDIFLKARAILSGYMGLSPLKKLILRGLLASPERLDRLASWAAKLQKLGIRPANETIGTSCVRLMSPLIDNRHFKPLADKPFHKRMPGLNSAPVNGSPKVTFYVGCLIDKVYPDIAQATIDVLHYHGVGVYMPEGQGCCGIPALSSGDTATFTKLLRHNVRKLESEKTDYLVTACATCTSVIKEIWPVMADDQDDAFQKRVQALSAKTMDINQFLVSKVGLKKDAPNLKTAPVTVAYHDPCHLKKTMGVFAEPRAVINAAAGYNLIEMDEADACCGMGGSFNLQYYGLSASIGKKKCANILATGCSVLATGCPACMMQISDALSQTGANIAVKHPIELYAEMVYDEQNST
jgi:glycolate oxidase iron-sulfur subunit